MKLIHMTERVNFESIRKLGLLGGYKPGKYTEWVAELLHVCKPNNTFKDLDTKKCVWFSPGNSSYRLKVENNSLNTLLVDSENLDKDKLFYVDGKLSERVKKSNPKPPEEILDIATKFWEGLKPFSEYMILHGEKEFLDRHIDVLYFGDVPPKHIEVYIE
ncbi:MAG: hypothetical protein L0L07_04525 [Staphylococcus equorum]|nr:hypothetical protein [Staphylococcus equorum]